jgi:hypothetical protein
MHYLITACAILCTIVPLASAIADAAPDPLFADDDLLELRIAAPLGTFVKERSDESYIDGKLSYSSNNGEVVELEVGIQARGLYRRRPDVCPFPPLRLNFKKSAVTGTLFDAQNKIKVVTHCRTGSYVLRQAVLKEYIAYRILNLFTEMSFRVRLLQVHYEDTEDGQSFTEIAFLIEHKKRLSARMEIPVLKVASIDTSKLDSNYVNLTSVFQFLIGNTDFSRIDGADGDDCCHNHSPFGSADGPYYSIPYDFDMSGIVNAPYATPNPKLRLDSVQERRYRGLCSNNALLPGTLEKFLAKRTEIEDLVRNQQGIGTSTRRDTLKYIDQFYRTIEREKTMQRQLVKRCR